MLFCMAASFMIENQHSTDIPLLYYQFDYSW
jgi:hypothetical protein